VRVDVGAVDLGRFGQVLEVADVAAGTASEVEQPPEGGELAPNDGERAFELDEVPWRRLVERLARATRLRRG
jgi:hypothetical protein